MFVESIKKAKKAMFPILRVETLPDSRANIAVVGTGFFVNEKGHFISVAHIFDNAPKNAKFFFAGFFPENTINPQQEILEISKDNAADVFIGKANMATPDFLALSDELPDVGRTVCIAGYPMPEVRLGKDGGIDVGGVRRYFQPTFVLDHGAFPTSMQGRMHQGFIVRDVGLFGMSGGPVLDVNGVVVGMQAAVTQPRVSSNGTHTISVENAVAIESRSINKTLKEKKII
jgi:S1-C subfamily serine protease